VSTGILQNYGTPPQNLIQQPYAQSQSPTYLPGSLMNTAHSNSPQNTSLNTANTTVAYFPSDNFTMQGPKPQLQSSSSWGPKPMSGQPVSNSEPVEPYSQEFSTEPEQHTSALSKTKYERQQGLRETTPTRKPPAKLTPAEQTVKRLEQPLVRFLEENPQLREKIDNINMDTLTDNLTNSMGSYRVSIHQAYNKFPRFIDDAIVRQLDPQMQDSARQFFEWIRKPPTAQELAESRHRSATRGNSGVSQKRERPLQFVKEEPPAKTAKSSWWPFKRKQQPTADQDLSGVSLDTLLNELKSRNI
jgi:hypothetical protein